MTKNIRKMTKDTLGYADLSVGKIVARDYRKALVFKAHGIDFCCGGKISLKEAADNVGVSSEQLISELEKLDHQGSVDEDFESMEITKLVDYIIDNHHEYTRKLIDQLTPMLDKVVSVHGGWRPELLEIRDTFKALSDELIMHMMKEEMVLFPGILTMVETNEINGQLRFPIQRMEFEHDEAGELLRKMRELSNDYTLPVGACATYTVVYNLLNEFEEDLHRHIHLENNVLFSKVMNLLQ